jgi:hypothetical protein
MSIVVETLSVLMFIGALLAWGVVWFACIRQPRVPGRHKSYLQTFKNTR